MSVLKKSNRLRWSPVLLALVLLSSGMVMAEASGVSMAQVGRSSIEFDRSLVARQMVEALENSPEVLTARAELRSAEADVDSSNYAAYPQVAFGVAGSNGESPSRSNPADSVDSRLSASLKYTVWDFGHTTSKQAAAALGRESALKRLDQSKEQFLRQLLVAYIQVSRYELLVEVGQNTRAALEELERLEAMRVALGGAGITDGTLASSRLALSMNKVLQFEQSLQDARLKLEALLGRPLEVKKMPLMRIPKMWTDGLAADIDPYDVSATLKAQRLNVDQARADLEADKGGQYPAVELTFTKRYESPGGYSDKSQVGLQVTVGSATALEASARIARSLSLVETEVQKLATMEREVRQKIQSGVQRQTLLDQRVRLLSSAAGDSSAVVDARRKLNQAGRETTLALLDAQVEANNTFVDWVQAIYDTRVGEVELAGDTGHLLPEEGYELAWLLALFNGEDYRADVRMRLTAIATAPVSQSTERFSPSVLAGLPSLRVGLAAPLNPFYEVAERTDVLHRTFFRLDMKPFERSTGSW